MTKTKELHAAKVVFKKQGWSVSVDNNVIGRADSLMKATDLLYVNGYKVYAYRRGVSPSGKIMFTADCLKFNYELENKS